MRTQELQEPKPRPDAGEEEDAVEEEVVYQKRPKKKVKRRVVVVQDSSSEEEIEVRLPPKKTRPAEPEPNPFLSNRVFSHPARYS